MKKILLFGIGLLILADVLLFAFILSSGLSGGKSEKNVADRSVARLLLLAREPLGQTMYIWGGGWNEEDGGAGREARTLGLSPVWKKYADQQDETYDYRKTRFQVHNGLDCSGYMGWVVYNLMETKSGEPGYVISSTEMAADFAERGFGEFTKAGEVKDWKAGDIMSMEGHVWMALGSCEDGSVVLIHSSPPGVRLCGTRLPENQSQTEDQSLSEGQSQTEGQSLSENQRMPEGRSLPKNQSQAERLAEKYMKNNYPDWYKRYPEAGSDYRYLTDSSRMRWSNEVLSDAEGLREMDAEEVLEWMFD
ncbi:MAG: hypothetical protein IJP31_08375 [Lachnospiraceae bacterium]|nr:hypothetical protein [Lachnospiraceae bacterium]